MNRSKHTRGTILFIAFSILCFSLAGCRAKQDDSLQALETKKITESFIKSLNKGDADACIGLLSSDIAMTSQNVELPDVRSIHEAIKSDIEWKHNWKIIEYLSNTENVITIRAEVTGEDMKLAGVDSVVSEITFEVKDGKIAKIVTTVDKKTEKQIAKNVAGGIGVGTDIKPDRVIITSILANSPAEKAGLKQGYEIMAIDGIKCSDMKQQGEQLIRIRGPVDSKVLLEVRRPDTQETYDVELIRADLSKLSGK
ncbi:MAG: PDZ domain-containing protein [Patescibacteria group bacterium]